MAPSAQNTTCSCLQCDLKYSLITRKKLTLCKPIFFVKMILKFFSVNLMRIKFFSGIIVFIYYRMSSIEDALNSAANAAVAEAIFVKIYERLQNRCPVPLTEEDERQLREEVRSIITEMVEAQQG